MPFDSKFQISRIPSLHIGEGKVKEIYNWLNLFKIKKVLVITGKKSIDVNGKFDLIEKYITKDNTKFERVICEGEPTASYADELIRKFHGAGFEGVISIGGGSVIDLGKALSAMIYLGNSVMDHIEIIGKGFPYKGVKLPFLVIPTTSGTGGEATKNAVLGKFDKNNGYKMSIRDEKLIPDSVIVDGDLLTTLPKKITIYSGFDSFTQLLESFLSKSSNEFTDAIVWSGLKNFVPNFLSACGKSANDPKVREYIGYASFCSGIGLTNADLGIVHGLANNIGSKFSIPHGIVCSSLMGSAQKTNFEALINRDNNNYALKKMSKVGRLFHSSKEFEDSDYINILTEKIEEWTELLDIPLLSNYGIKDKDIENLVDKANIRENPIHLTKSEIGSLIRNRI